MNRPNASSTRNGWSRPRPPGPAALRPHTAPLVPRRPIPAAAEPNGHSALKPSAHPARPPAVAKPCAPDAPRQSPPPEELELKLLLEAIYLKSGLDFRNYRHCVIQERVAISLQREGLSSISELQSALLRQPPLLERLLVGLTARHTCLFHEPAFYRALRQEIVPWLRTYPFARIWVAGCAGGGEAYSLATILLEESLQDRCRIYATDLCEPIVRQAEAGVWPIAALKRAAANYRRAGGTHRFVDYHTLKDGQARVSPDLGRNIVFAAHNLMTDASFNEFHLIVCREAMDDFDPILQAQAHELLYTSLMPRGVLALGRHRVGPSLRLSQYEPVMPQHGIYRKRWPN